MKSVAAYGWALSGVTERSFTITSDPDGFSVLSPGSEAKFWRWESVRTADTGGGYVFIFLFHRVLYLIARHFFLSEDDAHHFTGFIRNGIEKVRGNTDTSRKLRARRLRWWGLVGFVPNFGVIAGLILFFKGIFQFRDRWLVVIGVADVLFTVVFWFAVTRWEMNSGVFTGRRYFPAAGAGGHREIRIAAKAMNKQRIGRRDCGC